MAESGTLKIQVIDVKVGLLLNIKHHRQLAVRLMPALRNTSAKKLLRYLSVCFFFSAEVEVHTDQQAVETAVCVCGVILGLIGVVTGLWFITKANKSCRA